AGGLVGTHRGPRSGPVGARGGGEVGAGHDPRTFSRPHDVPWQSSRRGAPVDVSPQVAVRRGTLGGRVLARAARAATQGGGDHGRLLDPVLAVARRAVHTFARPVS